MKPDFSYRATSLSCREERRRGGAHYRNGSQSDSVLLSSVDGDDLLEALDNITQTLSYFVSGFQECYSPPDVGNDSTLNTSCSNGVTAPSPHETSVAPKAIGGTRAHWAPIVARWTVKLLGNFFLLTNLGGFGGS